MEFQHDTFYDLDPYSLYTLCSICSRNKRKQKPPTIIFAGAKVRVYMIPE